MPSLPAERGFPWLTRQSSVGPARDTSGQGGCVAWHRPQLHTALGHREGTCGWLLMLVKDTQDSGVDLLPLCLHTRAQKPGSLGGARGKVSELVTDPSPRRQKKINLLLTTDSSSTKPLTVLGFSFLVHPGGVMTAGLPAPHGHVVWRGEGWVCSVSGPACPALGQGGGCGC